MRADQQRPLQKTFRIFGDRTPVKKPLDGLKVVDLTHVLAGPYCTYQLGLLGAQVTKIESPRGDMVRSWGGTAEQLEQGLGTGFLPQNAGKRSAMIDIRQPAGADVVRLLAAQADIFVENYRPGTMARFGLDHERLMADNPKLIYLSISAFGQNGPESDRPGFDDVVQATSGFMGINQRGDGPIRTGGPVLDYATGMHATAAVLAAVLLREQTGEGQHIDIAMQDVTQLLMNRNTSIAATTGEAPPPAGNREGLLLGRYATRDGYVMLAGYLPRHQRRILAALGLDTLATLGARALREQAREIEAEVEVRLLTRTSAEWDAIFAERGVTAGGVRSLEEVLAGGQAEARGLLTDAESQAGPVRVTTAGYRINDEVFAPDAQIPELGRDTVEILSEAGLDDRDIAELLGQGVIAAADSAAR